MIGFWIYMAVLCLLAGVGAAYLLREFLFWLIVKIDDGDSE